MAARMPARKKALLALVVLLAIFAAWEVILRVVYHPHLPSLAGVDRQQRADARHSSKGARDVEVGCPFGAFKLAPATSWRAQARPFRLVVAGDSVVEGSGASSPDSGLVAVLGRMLRTIIGREVQVTNLGAQGSDYCNTTHRMRTQLMRQSADAAVLILFADDLIRFGGIAVGGETGMFPRQIKNPVVRVAASRSYVINQIWFAVRQASPAPVSPKLPPVRPQELSAFKTTLGTLVSRTRQNRGHLLVVLLAAPDRPLVAKHRSAPPVSVAMDQHLDVMVGLLREAKIPFLDLSRIWDKQPNRISSKENNFPDQSGIHPDDTGHALIAAAIFNALLPTLRGAQRR